MRYSVLKAGPEMSRRAIFIDTSVLSNLLSVPGKSQDMEKAQQDFLALQEDNSVQFVLPVTTVIETGNHIAQIKNGDMRREVAQRFGKMLESVCEREAPWVLHDFGWGESFLRSFLGGANSQRTWYDLAQERVGGGDLSILVEASMYQNRLQIDCEIWTYDAGLRAYAPTTTP